MLILKILFGLIIIACFIGIVLGFFILSDYIGLKIKSSKTYRKWFNSSFREKTSDVIMISVIIGFILLLIFCCYVVGDWFI